MLFSCSVFLVSTVLWSVIHDVAADCQSDRAAAQERSQQNGHPIVGVFIATCEPDGSYTATQCNPSTGYCWCVNRETGAKVPGSEIRGIAPDCSPANFGRTTTKSTTIGSTGTRSGSRTGSTISVAAATTSAPADTTKCRSERDSILQDLSKSDDTFYPTCDKKGMYMSFQCWNHTGTCWCVDKETGEKVARSERKTGEGKPKCSRKHKNRPTTSAPTRTTVAAGGVCEAERQRTLALKMADRWIHECDAEGNYEPLQCYGFTHTCYCADVLTGQKIPGTDGTEDNKPDCSAAALTRPGRCETLADQQKQDSTEDDEQFIMDCDEDGNFQSLQCDSQTVGNVCFCVDKMSGAQIPGSEGDNDNKPDCSAFSSN